MQTNRLNAALPYIVLAAFVVLALGWQVAFGAPVLRDENSLPAKLGASCTTSTTRSVPVGHQEALTVFSASTTRAWASIQVPSSATNTVAIAFGGTAAIGQGYQLVPTSYSGTGGTTTPSVQFGLNTDLPYTGAVTALTNTGSTTLLVTECNF